MKRYRQLVAAAGILLMLSSTIIGRGWGGGWMIGGAILLGSALIAAALAR